MSTQLTILFTFIALIWALELVDLLLFGGSLDAFGIRPRTPSGLLGIIFAPFLHGGLPHLVANTVPFLTLGWLVMLRRTSDFFVVTLIAGLVGGLGVWLVGRPNSVHIGASGLVFGYLGYLLLRGYFERSVSAILLSIAVGLFYGGALWGLLPSQPGVSWQAHLFGFLGGGGAARALARRRA
ncbi:MAG: rhomboid family intramembrane serine protease [Chloroflexi bacterium]|nr:rhomboid family intramembrane serine protease [Chloroflexota bacterium]